MHESYTAPCSVSTGAVSSSPGGASGALGTNAQFAARVELQGVAREWLSGMAVASERRRGMSPRVREAWERVYGPVSPGPALSPAKLEHRVCDCGRVARTDTVDLWYSPEARRASAGGVVSCGSSWACPVCAARIAAVRRAELEQALAVHRERGGRVLLVTLTARHSADMLLSDLLPRLLDAVRWMRSHREFKALWRSASCLGSTRTTEITHGDNGFHPHFHELWFCGAVDVYGLAARLSALWLRALAQVGLSGLVGIACDVREASLSVAEYLEKFQRLRTWDVDAELTQHVSKRGRDGSRSPFDLLRVGLAARLDDAYWMAAQAWVDYVRATYGRHMMQWSRGLRARLGLAARASDADIVARVDAAVAAEQARPPDEVPVGSLPARVYQSVVREVGLPSLLRAVETAWCDGGFGLVRDYIESLGGMTPRERRSWRRYQRGSPAWLDWDDRQWAAFQVWAFDVPPVAALNILAA